MLQVCHHTREGFCCNEHHLHHQSPGLGHVEIKARPLSPHLWAHNLQPVGQARPGPRLHWQAIAWAGAGRAPRGREGVCMPLCVCMRVPGMPPLPVCVYGGVCVECPFHVCCVCARACECVRNAPFTRLTSPAARSCLRRLVAQCIG